MNRPADLRVSDHPPIALAAQLHEGLAQLRAPTRELLSSLKNSDPGIRRLALLTAPFAVRAELIAHGLATDNSSEDDDRCVLTAVGAAALDISDPLSQAQREQLAEEADRALASAAPETTVREQSTKHGAPQGGSAS